MKYVITAFFLFIVFTTGLYGFEPHFASDPAISPDGSQVCIVYNGDLWIVPFKGGIARRLTATSTPESGPCWSPDGKSIAFNSNREGQSWVYIIPSTGGTSKLLFKENMSVCDWFSDSENLLCSKGSLNFGTSLYRVPLSGRKSLLISEVGDYYSSLSPDNRKIMFNRYGDPFREAYRGSTNGELWEYDLGDLTYRKLTSTDTTERYPVYSSISDAVFYAASDGQRFQLCKVLGGKYQNCEFLSEFDTWSVRDISIALHNDRIVFELFDTIWCFDPDKNKENQFYKLPVEIAEDVWSNLNIEESLNDTFDKFAVSDNELLVAFSYKYDLFIMPRKGGEVRQVTFNQNGVENLSFMRDNRTIVFSQYADGVINLYQAFIDSVITIKPVDWYGSNKFNIDTFYKSSDYHWVIEYTDTSGSGRIAVSDSVLKNFKPVITDKDVSSQFVCSPDGKMAVFAAYRDDIYIQELFLYDFASGSRRKVMNDDDWLYGLKWLPDQRSILLSKSDNSKGIYRLDLLPRDDMELDTDNWKEILSKEVKSESEDSLSYREKAAAKRLKKQKILKNALSYTRIDWTQIDKRLYPIVTDPENIYAVEAIDDTSFYYMKDVHSGDGKTTLNKINIFGKNNSEFTSFPRDIDYQYIEDKAIYFKEGIKLKALNLKSKSRSDISNNFRYTYNLKKLNETVFEQAWGIFGRNFYDPDMHDRNWEELFYRYRPYLQYAESTQVLEAVIEEMIGELNASHTGFYPRSDNKFAYKSTAYLGLEFNQRKNLQEGLEISRIYPGTVLYNYYGIRDGDILFSINGTIITPLVPVDSLLVDMVGKKLNLSFLHKGNETKAIVKGLSWSDNRELWFQDKIESRRNKTNELSNNRIGYLLIPRMNNSEYTNFISDLFTKNADKEALIIDIRGNGGGRIHNELLDFLSKKPNAYSTRRNSGAVKNFTPGRTWTKPIVLLMDENSFSDAEIFPQLFKESKLGTVVGMPTSGSVIGTWEYTLMDGSSMRLPGSGWYRLDGTNMEGNGAQPDVLVEMSLNDIVADNDTQLQKAVEILLDKIK
jgi:tricorn protease